MHHLPKGGKVPLVQTNQKEWENLEIKLKSSLSNQIQKTNNEIIRVKTEIKAIEEKLNVQHDALYGYLEKNVKDWHNTIGKVVNEELLFRTDLTPTKVENKGDLSVYGISLKLDDVSVVSKTIEVYQFEKNERLAIIRDLEESLNQFQGIYRLGDRRLGQSHLNQPCPLK